MGFRLNWGFFFLSICNAALKLSFQPPAPELTTWKWSISRLLFCKRAAVNWLTKIVRKRARCIRWHCMIPSCLSLLLSFVTTPSSLTFASASAYQFFDPPKAAASAFLQQPLICGQTRRFLWFQVCQCVSWVVSPPQIYKQLTLTLGLVRCFN